MMKTISKTILSALLFGNAIANRYIVEYENHEVATAELPESLQSFNVIKSMHVGGKHFAVVECPQSTVETLSHVEHVLHVEEDEKDGEKPSQVLEEDNEC